MIEATQIREGMIISLENELYEVLESRFQTMGNWRSMMQLKLRNLKNGVSVEKRISAGDKVKVVYREEIPATYLYDDKNGYYFLEQNNYEEIFISREKVEPFKHFLVPNIEVTLIRCDNVIVSLKLPATVKLKVVETEPQMKTATITKTYKPAKTETGLVVSVPTFIEVGNTIIVDTRTGEYIGKE
ncbi:MAG: elongation factor P [Planctomycetota bacterium]